VNLFCSPLIKNVFSCLGDDDVEVVVVEAVVFESRFAF
jgi:hypothetical protein